MRNPSDFCCSQKNWVMLRTSTQTKFMLFFICTSSAASGQTGILLKVGTVFPLQDRVCQLDRFLWHILVKDRSASLSDVYGDPNYSFLMSWLFVKSKVHNSRDAVLDALLDADFSL